jgi:hypothetical protein
MWKITKLFQYRLKWGLLYTKHIRKYNVTSFLHTHTHTHTHAHTHTHTYRYIYDYPLKFTEQVERMSNTICKEDTSRDENRHCGYSNIFLNVGYYISHKTENVPYQDRKKGVENVCIYTASIITIFP